MKSRLFRICVIVLVLHLTLTVVARYIGHTFGSFLSTYDTTVVVQDKSVSITDGSQWIHFDSGYYIKLAQNGYPHSGTPVERPESAFFPAYPTLLRIVDFIVPSGISYAGWLLGYVISVLVVLVLSLLINPQQNISTLQLYVISAFPSLFYAGGVLSDGLLALFSATCILMMQKKKYRSVAVLLFILPLTKLLGILVFFPVLIHLYGQFGIKKSIAYIAKSYWPLLGSFFGGLAVLAHNYSISGSPLFFVEVVTAVWARTNSLVGVVTRIFDGPGLLVLTIFAVVALSLVIFKYLKERDFGMLAWGVLYIGIPLLSSPLGQIRYSLANIPLLLAVIAIWANQSQIKKYAWSVLSTLLYLGLGTLWMLDHGIMQ